MSPPILSDDPASLRPPVAKPPAILVIAVLWLTLACGLPLYQLREVRRQTREDLLRVVKMDKPDAASLVAAFDRANRNLDAAASGPCLLLAFTSILLVNRLLGLKRRYDALAHEVSTAGHPAVGADSPSEE